MKPVKFTILLIAATILIAGCKKKDNTPSNYFSFKGKTYEIVEAYQGAAITAHQPLDSTIILHVHQLAFFGVSGKDTAALFLAIGDEASSNMDGNYSSLAILSSANRGIIPEAIDSDLIVANSVIILGSSEGYETGSGGSMDIAVSGSTYTVKFNAISAGLYSNQANQYNEIGTINGKYSGAILLVTFSTLSGNFMFNRMVLERRSGKDYIH